MKTKDLYLTTMFNLLPKVDFLSAFAHALITTIALIAAFAVTYFVYSVVTILVTMIFAFIASNFAGIVLAIVLIAALKKMVLR